MGQIHAPFSTSPTSTADDAPDADPPRVKETSAIGGGGPGSTPSEEEEEEEEEEEASRELEPRGRSAGEGNRRR